MRKSMQVLYDNIVFDIQRSGGISVVWYELLKRIRQNSTMNPMYIDNNSNFNQYRHLLNIDDSEIIKRDVFPAISRYFPVLFNSKTPFVFHSSYYRYCNSSNARNVTTVHDFTYELYRSGLAKTIHCWQKYNAIRHSDIVVCISENTKRDLLNYLPDVSEDKIRVIYNGVSEDYFVMEKGSANSKLPFEKNSYVVFVGNRIDKYKNFNLLIRSISSTPYNLVIVGSALSEEEKNELRNFLPESRYMCTGFLANKELNIIYNNAAALVYPSEYEGFGIPVIEAQKAGCPVIAYNSSSIPEIIGSTPLLMNEVSEKELIGKINMLSDRTLMNNVVADGLANSKRFSWDKMYQQYIDLYSKLV